MKYKKLKVIKYVLIQRCKGHENWSLNRIQRWFYTLKSILCILFGLRKQFTWDDDIIDGVAYWDHSTNPWGYYGSEYDWTELDVGYGYFKNWKYDVIRNGT